MFPGCGLSWFCSGSSPTLLTRAWVHLERIVCPLPRAFLLRKACTPRRSGRSITPRLQPLFSSMGHTWRIPIRRTTTLATRCLAPAYEQVPTCIPTPLTCRLPAQAAGACWSPPFMPALRLQCGLLAKERGIGFCLKDQNRQRRLPSLIGLCGSGSHENGRPFKVVAMEKEFQTSIVHHERFREGECFADKASQTLSESIVPAFNMSRFPVLFPHSAMLLFWKHCLIGDPKIRKTVTPTVS